MRKIFLPIMAAIFALPILLYPATQDLPFTIEESFLCVRGGTVRVLDITPKKEADPVHLLCIPGGPGCSSQGFLRGVFLKAFDGYCMRLYDPLGTGKSTPALKKDMKVCDELRRLHSVCADYKKKVGAEVPIALYGSSWGAALAAKYAVKYSSLVSQVILQSPLLSTEKWQSDTRKLLLTLPSRVQKVIAELETKKAYDTPGYKQALTTYGDAFCWKFFRPFTPEESLTWEPCKEFYFQDSPETNREIYQTMWGPSEFTVRGTLKEFDCLSRLGGFGKKMPVALIIGECDQVLPETAQEMAEHSKAELHCVKNASHSVIFENPEALNALLKAITAQKR